MEFLHVRATGWENENREARSYVNGRRLVATAHSYGVSSD